MNRYVDILNRIRQNASPSWLTGSQQVVYSQLLERLGHLDEVNLWGSHGVGKTFLGWVLRAQGVADYVSRLEDVRPDIALRLQRTIVVDNLGWHRADVRNALHQCRSQGYEKVVLITTEPAQDQICTIQLSLTEGDIEKAVANLCSVGVAPYTDAPRSLWDLVSPVELTV